MKKISMLLFLLVGLLSTVSAQDVIAEGHLVLELNDVSADDPALAQQLEMMKGAELEVFFNESGSLTKMDMMGGMIKSTSLNSNDGTGKLLMDMMGQKMYIPFDKAEADKAKESSEELWESVDITYDESDTKVIQGITCHKMTVAPKEGETGGLTLSGYITKSIKAKANIMNVDTEKFAGFPLEISLGMGGGTMTFTATKFEKSADPSVFALDTGGYKEMTFQEFMDMMSQFGGGGMGF